MTSDTSTTPSTDRILAGVALMLGFCVTAPLLDVAAKLASGSVPVGQITTARSVVQCVLMAPFVWIMGLSLRVARGQWPALLGRDAFAGLDLLFHRRNQCHAAGRRAGDCVRELFSSKRVSHCLKSAEQHAR